MYCWDVFFVHNISFIKIVFKYFLSSDHVTIHLPFLSLPFVIFFLSVSLLFLVIWRGREEKDCFMYFFNLRFASVRQHAIFVQVLLPFLIWFTGESIFQIMASFQCSLQLIKTTLLVLHSNVKPHCLAPWGWFWTWLLWLAWTWYTRTSVLCWCRVLWIQTQKWSSSVTRQL